MTRFALAVLASLSLALGIAAVRSSGEDAPAPAPHDNRNAVLWVRSAPEYRMQCVQAYAHARARLDANLADPTITASAEQERAGGFEQLPPAVILDVDETVLDNTDYQAWLVARNESYSPESWAKWADARRATAVAGAVGFVDHAHAKGVEVYFVTNRDIAEEPATIENLARIGIDTGWKHVLSRNQLPDWTSDKTTRRAHIAGHYRILLLVGDSLNDFVSARKLSPEMRMREARFRRGWWGSRWIILPNPTYGSWERAFAQETVAETRRAKDAALAPWVPEGD